MVYFNLLLYKHIRTYYGYALKQMTEFIFWYTHTISVH